MELKLECGCGQKYEFDVEPVDGQMPVPVGCPSCGVDGTARANAMIAQTFAAAEPAKPAVARMSMQRAHEEAKPAAVRAPAVTAPPAIPTAKAPAPISARPGIRSATPQQAQGEPNLPMGILGAFLGAAVGAGLAYAFTMATGIRFPFIGVGIGYLTALGGRLLCRGTDQKLGFAAAGFAVLAVGGTLVACDMFSIFSIISLIVSVSVAYRAASG